MNDLVNQPNAMPPTLFDGADDKQALAVAGTQAGEFNAEIGRMQYPRVKVLQHGIHYLPVGGDKDNPLIFGSDARQMFGAIVKSTKQITRICFDKDYDPQSTTAPTVICRSGNGMKPDSDVAEPIGISCASCRFNQAFSSGNGTKAKKCKYRLPILVVPAVMVDAGDGTGRQIPQFHPEVCAMTINSTSILGDNLEDKNLFNLGTYESKLGTKGANINQVLTTFLLDQRPGAMCKSLFTSSYVLTDADVAQLQQIMDDCPYDLDEMLGTVEEDAADAVPEVPATNTAAPPQEAVAPAAVAPAATAPAQAAAPAPTPQAQAPAPATATAPAQAAAPASPAQPAPTGTGAPPPPAPATAKQAPAAPATAAPAAEPAPTPAAADAAPASAPDAGVVASETSGAGQPGPNSVDDPSLSW